MTGTTSSTSTAQAHATRQGDASHVPGPPTVRPGAGEVAVARVELLVHRLDPQHGRCSGCGGSSPCETANEAAWVIVAAQEWNSLPFAGPAGPGRPRRAGAGESRGNALTRARARLTRGARALTGRGEAR